MNKEYTPEMQAYNRLRLLRRIARSVGYRLSMPFNFKVEDIDTAAIELSTIIEIESNMEA